MSCVSTPCTPNLALDPYTTHGHAVTSKQLRAALLVFLALLAFPSVRGVPHTIGSARIVYRAACLAVAFAACEQLHMARQHWAWLYTVSREPLSTSFYRTVYHTQKLLAVDARRVQRVHASRSAADGGGGGRERGARQMQALDAYLDANTYAFPGAFVTLSVIQCAWLLSLSHELYVTLGTAFIVLATAHAASRAASPFPPAAYHTEGDAV